MPYAIDLSSRQTTRTLEQAVRHHADVILHPRTRRDDESIPCRLASIEKPTGWRARRPCLVLEPTGEDNEVATLKELVGTYCDANLQLGENRYLFCGDVVAISGPSNDRPEPRIYIARPETVQVAQRRRFWRFRPAQSARVELRWTNHDSSTGAGVGWLCNVSGDGLACRVDSPVADQLGIGEPLHLEFSLMPGDPERYRLDAILCNKTPAGTEGTIILGLKFSTEEEASARAAETLREQLLARYAPVVDSSGGADR